MALYVNVPGSSWTTVTIVQGSDIDIAFDGNGSTGIEIVAYIANATASGSTLSIQPNASASNMAYQEVFGANATAGAQRSTTVGAIGFNSASNNSFFRLTMFTKTGIPRFYFGTYMYMGASNAITSTDQFAGRFNDTSTAITSLRIHSDQAAGIGANSQIIWRPF